ncbi:protein phosphatase CheZ [Halodesulfovibrio marinisediminis]|uniref:Chemotaxis protein CheZ n=1 Tax=Halodesulfovibrio marinisediminis DSM 17456 TaxID=1121457 RepID=A0A1N6E0I7_9BACT|nr:protein phosphatase CheZ [Halodesulfovibrio marinisediminis]SIN76565.1 chemotaxis protein CheZ [Halodesulfovibrio marinisediminis DSM 17456]
MTTNDANVMDEILDRVSSQIANSITQTITTSVENTLSEHLTQALMEGEFYKKLSIEMHEGLQSIYSEITASDTPNLNADEEKQATQLFGEASEQLDAVYKTLENATDNIMTIVEQQIQMRELALAHLQSAQRAQPDNKDLAALASLENKLSQNMNEIMTALSFQDLAGQRILRIISALQKLKTTVFDLYSTSDFIAVKKAERESQAKQADSTKKVDNSELKGPSETASQSDVDNLLASLGL